MSDSDTRTFVVEAEGDAVALEQLHTVLRGVAKEGRLNNVGVEVSELTEETDEDLEFTNGTALE